MKAWKTKWNVVVALLLFSGQAFAAVEEGPFDAPAEFYVSGEPASLSEATRPPVNYEIFHKLTMQAGFGPEESRLGSDNDMFYNFRYEPTFIWYSPEKVWSKWMIFGRAWFNYDSEYIGSSSLSDDNSYANRKQPEYFYSELRELYIKRNLIGDDPRFSASLGRQRFYDKYGVWWDDSIESLRLNYTGTFMESFLAVARKYYYYNTDVNKLDPRDDKITYIFGESFWRWSTNNRFGVRLMYEEDSSANDPEDPEDFTGFRYGLFFTGDKLDLPFTDYHLELMWLTGEVDTTAANWQTHQYDVEGWAVIGEIGKRFTDVTWQPRIALYGGITDDPGANDYGFRLNRIQSDRIIRPGSYSTHLVSSFVRINLQNVMYYGVALNTNPTDRSSLDLRLSDIYLRDTEGDLPITLDTRYRRQRDYSSHSIGQVFDVTYYWKMFPQAHEGKHFDLNYLINASYFRAGDAIDSGDDYQASFGIVLKY
jgi:hypothetical protein